jgi:peroxiredoxin
MDSDSAPLAPPMPAGVARAGRRRSSRTSDRNGDPIHQARVDRRRGGRHRRAIRRAAGVVRLPQDGATDPPGWDKIPGARGCTQESCAYRDLHQEFRDLGWSVVGLSSQASDEQKEASVRLHLPFPLLADSERQLGGALRLPTFAAAGITLYKRLTFVAREGRIVKVFYPVFPPQDNAGEVLARIR